MTEHLAANPTVTAGSDTGILRKIAPAMLSVMLGVVILSAVGFAPGMAHNAAHDTRHVMVFPCH